MDFVVGYVVTFLGLEMACHFVVCRLRDKRIKQVKSVITPEIRYVDRGWTRIRESQEKRGW